MDELRLQDAVIFLAAAGIVIPLGKRMRVSPVLGFLLIGLAVGPYGFARLVTTYEWLRHILIIDVAGVRALAELGVVFLLFMIGLKLSIKRLWAMRRLVFGLGSAQVGVTSVVIGGFAWAFGNSLEAAIVLGGCLALSSTAIVMQLLTEQGRFGSAVGRGSFAVLLAQDLAVVPILFLVGALGAESGGATGAALGLAVGKAALAVLLILGAGHALLRPLFRFVGNPHSPELFMAATLLIVIATAATTHAAGLSAALGAFLAGLLFAETEFRHQIEADIEPFKGLLLGLFFMSVGMTINLAEILQDPGWVVLSVAGLFAIKTTITTLLARLFGFSFAQAIEMGLLLGEGGEFAFVVVGLAMSFALLPEQTAQFMLIVVSATMFLTPLAARFARTVGRELESRDGREAAEVVSAAPELADHVVIAGYGRTGQLLAQILDRQRIVHLALDLNAARVTERHAAGAPVYLGDASRAPMLARMQLAHAAALVVTTDDTAAAERVVQAARRLHPQLPIVARARDQAHAERLLAQGATQVVLEVREAGLEMGRVTLEHSGLPADAARDLIDAMRVE
ncbi:MAG: monovalent cation:proton antiporter-2 (CPA2) family protein [Gammaproteobacteria bacterium]|jgi:monovalent cation:proton antiporter-2 (CPA2) family protein